MPHLRLQVLKRGADAYLSKPFQKEELLVRLEKLAELRLRLIKRFSTIVQDEMFVSQSLNEESVAIQIENAFIQKIKNILEDNYQDDQFSLVQLCEKIYMSRSQLYRKMKALIDTSPSQFIRSFRLQKAKSLLETTDMNVTEVAWEVGYKDISHFSKSFQEEFKKLPSEI